MKTCGNHADNGVALSVKRDALAHDVPCRLKLPTPQAFADQCNRSGADFILARRKCATEKWIGTKNREEVRRDELAGHLLGFPSSGQAERITAPNRHRSERAIVLLPVAKIQIRDGAKLKVRLALPECDELFRTRIRQRIQKHPIDHRKQCRVRADAESD